MNKPKKLIKVRRWCVAVSVCLGFAGCTEITQETGEFRLKHKETGRHFTNPPLSEEWKNLEVINYGEGRFTFPPPAGYNIIQYANYTDNVSLEIYRELIDVDDLFPDIINRRRKADHCKLILNEEMEKGLPSGMESLEAEGDCYIWHQGEYVTRYYFLRVGYVVFTFRLTSGKKEYEKNLKDFTRFVNYTVKGYLVYPAEDKSSTQEYAYPISRQELISFLEPALKAYKKAEKKNK